ncbi:UNKNOWN [Stylonychia lemnae]|uniref:Uncharacterized protein n=1 Tax=Stylonychia lemnae TaxID=5949 RepID=A0A078AA08_STYLE|nr:UNKNOWN [Stylonychia lemnae]|eukprot:CDW77653.1 UNKNOWN [Stylonychia lemnae]
MKDYECIFQGTTSIDSNQVKVPGLFNLEEVIIPRKPDVYSTKNSSVILNDKLSTQSEVTRNQQYRTESFKHMNNSLLRPLLNERPPTNNYEKEVSIEIISDVVIMDRLETQNGDQGSMVQKELQLSRMDDSLKYSQFIHLTSNKDRHKVYKQHLREGKREGLMIRPDNQQPFMIKILKGKLRLLTNFGEISQSYFAKVQNNSAVIQDIQYTQIDPITEKKLVGISKRIDFNRKFERSDLSLLIIKYDGLIGMFDKVDITSENQQLIVRPGLSKLLKILHQQFQIVIYIQQDSQEKYKLMKQHARTYKCSIRAKEIFFDGIYKSYNKWQTNYSQILVDFETPRERDNVYILEALNLTDLDRESIEVQRILDMQVNSEFEITRIFLPHIQIFNDYKNNNICLKMIAEYIQTLFQENEDSDIVMRDTAELKAMRIKAGKQFLPHYKLPEYVMLTLDERPLMDTGTYNRLLMQNTYIQQQISFYKTKFENRVKSRESQSKLIETMQKQRIYEKQIIYLCYQDSEQFQKIYNNGNKLQLDEYSTVTRQKDECDIFKEILRKKMRQI